MGDHGNHAAGLGAGAPLADPVREGGRLVESAGRAGLRVRLLGGVAVRMQAPAETPLLPRPIGDIDLVTRQGGWRVLADFLKSSGYEGDDMFNALNGARRLLFFDHANNRKLDVFVGEFEMCHSIPIAGRLERQPMTIPLAELLLTKLQVVQLTERDIRDFYSLCYHHELSDSAGAGIEADFIADLCAKDWGLWRTCTSTIQQCVARMPDFSFAPEVAGQIASRLSALLKRIELTPKTARWKLR